MYKIRGKSSLDINKYKTNLHTIQLICPET
jgi:hypothetical protein